MPLQVVAQIGVIEAMRRQGEKAIEAIEAMRRQGEKAIEVMGYWRLAMGLWLLVIGYWLREPLPSDRV